MSDISMALAPSPPPPNFSCENKNPKIYNMSLKDFYGRQTDWHNML